MENHEHRGGPELLAGVAQSQQDVLDRMGLQPRPYDTTLNEVPITRYRSETQSTVWK